MSLKWHLPEEEEGDIKSKVQLKKTCQIIDVLCNNKREIKVILLKILLTLFFELLAFAFCGIFCKCHKQKIYLVMLLQKSKTNQQKSKRRKKLCHCLHRKM